MTIFFFNWKVKLCWQECIKDIANGNVYWYRHGGTQFGNSKKIQHNVTIIPSNSTLMYASKITENMFIQKVFMNVHSSIKAAKYWK